MNASSHIISPFYDALNHRHSINEQLQADGANMIGYFCTYTPVELLHAAGFIPMRITGGTGPVEQVYAHAPDFICPFMKRALEDALSGTYDYLSGVIQGYTCDAACGMINVWRENIDIGFYHLLPLPYNTDDGARRFMASALKETAAVLNAQGGVFSEMALSKSMDLYARIRKILSHLHDLLHAWQLPMTARQLFAVTAAFDIMPPEAYLAEIEKLAGGLPEPNRVEAAGCPVLLSGSLVESDEIFEAIAIAGGRVVADDLCNGYRKLHPTDGMGGGPMHRLIDRYMKRLPCPSRSHAEERAETILGLMKKSGARGMVCVVQKFCTPHLADFPIISKILGEHGYPAMMLEMDETWEVGGQWQTRLEGFFEMLEAS